MPLTVCAFLLDVGLINVLAPRHHGPMLRNMAPEPGRGGGGPFLIKRAAGMLSRVRSRSVKPTARLLTRLPHGLQ